jgi:hypothetical protein
MGEAGEHEADDDRGDFENHEEHDHERFVRNASESEDIEGNREGDDAGGAVVGGDGGGIDAGEFSKSAEDGVGEDWDDESEGEGAECGDEDGFEAGSV